jgi:hypothetical protein
MADHCPVNCQLDAVSKTLPIILWSLPQHAVAGLKSLPVGSWNRLVVQVGIGWILW